MNRFTQMELKLWHALVIAAVLLALTGGAIALAETDSISALWGAGKVRFASSYGDTYINVSGTGQPPVLIQNVAINVPDGKRADVQATWSATLIHNGNTFAYCYGRFSLDGSTDMLNPGEYQLMGGAADELPNGMTVAMAGFRKNIGPGNHTINVYVKSAYEGCQVAERVLNVIVNIR